MNANRDLPTGLIYGGMERKAKMEEAEDQEKAIENEEYSGKDDDFG
jgi:hypothetical protein